MDGLLQDIRYALRANRKAPGFTALALLTVALGIGASTAIFSMVDGVLLRALPYPSGDRVVRLEQPALHNHGVDAGFSIPELADYRAGAPALDAVVEYHSMPFQLFGRGDPQRVQTGVVSDGFFDVLGIRPLLGRLFVRGEEAPGAPPVVVLGYRYWRERLLGDSSVVGTTFTMNDRTHRIIGVLPPLPAYPNDNDLWMPAGACPFRSSPMMAEAREMRMVRAFGRLRAGAGLAAGRRDVEEVSRRLHAQYPASFPETNPLGIRATPLFTELTGSARPILFTLLAAAAFLLLIAAANFTNLTLARQLRRTRELTVRGALGAGDGRLVRQLAVESLCLTIPGGVLGVAVAVAGLGVLRALAVRTTPRAAEIGLDGRVLAFALAASVLVGIAAAVAPFGRLRRIVQATLRRGDGGGSAGPGEGRLRHLLVGVQLAMAFVVLLAAGLMTGSTLRLQRVDETAEAARITTARVDLDWSRYTSGRQVRTFADLLLARLAGIPGVETAALASDFPLNSETPFRSPVLVERPGSGEPVLVRSDLTSVGPGYFTTLGIPLIAGRTFTAVDRDTLTPPVIVGQRFARTQWPGGNPLGRRISADSGRHWSEVVGVVADVHQNSLAGELTDEIYVPFAASPSGTIRVLVRARAGTIGLEGRIRGAVRELDDRQPVDQVRTVREVRDARLTQPRLTTVLLGCFAILALLITAAGVNGVVAHGVGQRLRELAIRQALGASAGRVLGSVLGPLLATAIGGLGAGLLAAVPLTRLMGGVLFEVAPSDPLIRAGVGIVLLAITGAAAVLPARAALRVDPARALRAE